MTQYLPPNLLALFEPRPPIPYLPPVTKLPHEKHEKHEKKNRGYSGVGSYMGFFEDPKNTPPPIKIETLEERRKLGKDEQVYKLKQEIALWKPNHTTHPYKTLFVSRLNYETSESKLQSKLERYGPIKKISVTHNKTNAFIEYENAPDMYSAFKHADGKNIDGHRVLEDIEKAHTVKGWLPRRLGGGLRGTRQDGSKVNVKHSGRKDDERERDHEMAYRHSRHSITGRYREHDYHDLDRDLEPRRSRTRERERKHHCSKSCSCKHQRRCSRNCGTRDVEYDEVEKVLVSKTRDKDNDCKRKRKRSSSKDLGHKRDRKERDNHLRDKSKDGRDNNKDKIHIKQEPVDAAFKHADGKNIDGHRVLEDIEKAHTVKGWLPRRLGGGLRGTRQDGSKVNVKHSGRKDNERERDHEMAYRHSRHSITGRYREHDYHDLDRDHEPRLSRTRERERKHHCSKSCSCKHQRRCSRNCGTRDVEYDEVEKVLVSKTRDKDNDCKRKRKRSSSKDLGHKRDRKERDNHLRDKSKDGRDNNKDKIHIKQEPVDAAFKHADGKNIDGHRVLVDIEKAHPVNGWLPRRLGGGLRGTRQDGSKVNVKHSGREDNERERDHEMAYRHSRHSITGRYREHDYHDLDRDREPRRSRTRERERKHHCSKSILNSQQQV